MVLFFSFFLFFFKIGKKRNRIKKRKAPLSIHGVYKDTKTKEKQKTNEETRKNPKDKSNPQPYHKNAKPSKNLGYFTQQQGPSCH
jgi:hypothetical protein